MPDQPTISLKPSHVLCVCLKCGTQFGAHPTRIREGRGKYCSRACMWSNREERVCQRCGKSFSFRKGGTHVDDGYCTQACRESKERWKLEAHRGSNTEEVACSYCGKIVTQYASRIRHGQGKYCSKECFDAIRRGISNTKATVEKVACPCPICGKVVMRLPCHVHRLHCSRQCRGKSMRGENHPRWVDDRSLRGDYRNATPYKRWRAKVFVRDDYTCQDCGKRGGEIHAHHLQTYAAFPALRYEITNGVTLCRVCHYKRHRK